MGLITPPREQLRSLTGSPLQYQGLWLNGPTLTMEGHKISVNQLQLQYTEQNVKVKKHLSVVAPPVFLVKFYETNTILWRHDVMLWCHTVTSHNQAHNVTPEASVLYHGTQTRNSWKLRFLTWWPWPMNLIIERVQDIIKVNLCTKFHDHPSNGSAVRVPTHTQTHRPDCYYKLYHWRGR